MFANIDHVSNVVSVFYVPTKIMQCVHFIDFLKNAIMC